MRAHAVLALVALGVTNCALFAKAAPAGVVFAECVVDHAVAGDTLAQIADACAGDIPAIIQVLVSSTDPRVERSRALGEARRAEVVLRDGGTP